MHHPSPLALSQLLPHALLAVAEIGEPHGIKAALALDRLDRRFPQWSDAQRTALLEHSQFHRLPRIAGPLAPQVATPLRYGPRAGERLIANGVFPMAYRAASDWAADIGTAGVIAHFRDRALDEPNYLAHGLSIWLSFTEAGATVQDTAQQALLLERFVEFASRMFRGFPHHDSAWSPPIRKARPVGFHEAFEVATRMPGFYGHHLIALAWSAHSAWLDDAQRGRALQTVVEVAQADYADAVDRLAVDTAAPISSIWADDEWPQRLHAFAMAMRSNIHAATLADALAILWDRSGDAARRRLMAAMRTLAGSGWGKVIAA